MLFRGGDHPGKVVVRENAAAVGWGVCQEQLVRCSPVLSAGRAGRVPGRT